VGLSLHRFTMAAAGWNQETKARLSEKVAVNMNDLASLTKHVLRGSKSSDVSEHFDTSSSSSSWKHCKSKIGLVNTYSVFTGPVQITATSITFSQALHNERLLPFPPSLVQHDKLRPTSIFVRRPSCLELTARTFATNHINRTFQALSKNVFIRADSALSALETFHVKWAI